MEFVAQKLGFLMCHDQTKAEPNGSKRSLERTTNDCDDSSIKKKRKLSNEDSSSDSSSLSLGKLKLSDSSESDKNESKLVSIPIPIRAILETQSLMVPTEYPHFSSMLGSIPMSLLEGLSQGQWSGEFHPNEYLSSLVAPYGTPTRYIGPITVEERRKKVEKYLEKKNSRHWKNVKYVVRQELAQGRKRNQGRFVKSDKKWRWNEIGIKLSNPPIDPSHPSANPTIPSSINPTLTPTLQPPIQHSTEYEASKK